MKWHLGWLVASLVLASTACSGQGSRSGFAAEPARCSSTPGTVRLSRRAWRGKLLRSSVGVNTGSGASSLRTALPLDARTVSRGGAGRRLEVRHAAGSNRAEMDFHAPESRVQVVIEGRDEGVDIQATVEPTKGTILALDLPARLRFDPARMERFVSPLIPHDGVGAVFRSSFFSEQTRAAGWQAENVGPSAYARLLREGVVMHDMAGAPGRHQSHDDGKGLAGRRGRTPPSRQPRRCEPAADPVGRGRRAARFPERARPERQPSRWCGRTLAVGRLRPAERGQDGAGGDPGTGAASCRPAGLAFDPRPDPARA